MAKSKHGTHRHRPFRDFDDAEDTFATLLFLIETEVETCPPKVINALNQFLDQLHASAVKQGTRMR